MSLTSVDNARLLAEAKRYGAERDINPYIALLEEVRRSAGHVTWLGWKVESAPTDDALLDTHVGWLKLYIKEREHLTKVCETAVRLGLEERVVRMEERKAELMARADKPALRAFLSTSPRWLRRPDARDAVTALESWSHDDSKSMSEKELH